MFQSFLNRISLLIFIFCCEKPETKYRNGYQLNRSQDKQNEIRSERLKSQLLNLKTKLENLTNEINNISKIEDLDIYNIKLRISELEKSYEKQNKAYISLIYLADRTYSLLDSSRKELDNFDDLIKKKQKELFKFFKINQEDSNKILSIKKDTILGGGFKVKLEDKELLIDKIDADDLENVGFFGKYDGKEVVIKKERDYKDQLIAFNDDLTSKIYEIFKDQNNGDWLIMEKLDEIDNRVLAPGNSESKDIIIKTFESLKLLESKGVYHEAINPLNLKIKDGKIRFVNFNSSWGIKFFSSPRNNISALARTILHYRFNSLIEKNIGPINNKILCINSYYNNYNTKLALGEIKIKDPDYQLQKISFFCFLNYDYFYLIKYFDLNSTLDILEILYSNYLINPNKKTKILKKAFTDYLREDYIEYIDTLDPIYNESSLSFDRLIKSNYSESFKKDYEEAKEKYRKNFWVNHDNPNDESGFKKILKTYCNYELDKFDEILMLAADNFSKEIDINTLINNLKNA